MRVVPPIKAIVYFEATARMLSFKHAAEELCVSPGAVSHQINILEDFIGQKLFNRANRSLKLTNAGLRYYTRTSFILSELEQASADLGKHNKDEMVKIAVPPTLLNYWLIPNLNINKYTENNISLEFFETVTSEKRVRNGEIDIAIYYGLQKPSDVFAQHLFDEEMIVVCSPSLLQQYPIKETKVYLLSTPLIYTTNRLIQWDVILHNYQINAADILQKVVFQNSIQGINAAIHGMGLALVNKMLVKSLLEKKLLIEPLKLKPRHQLTPAYYLTTRLDAIKKPIIKFCIDDMLSLI